MKKMRIEEVKKHVWYRQGFDGSLFFMFVPYSTAFEVFGRENVFLSVEGKHGNGFWTKESVKPIIENVFQKQKKERIYADKMVSTWEMIEKKKHDLPKRFGDISKFDQKQLEMFMKHFISIDYEQWCSALYPDVFDTVDQEALEEEFKSVNVEISKEDLDTLLKPIVLSFNQQLELDLLKTAILPEEEIRTKLKEMKEKYFFIRNDWAHVEYLDESYFFELMKNVVNQDVDKRIKELENYTKKRKDENTKILQRYKIPYDTQNLFYVFQRLARFRDDRKLAAQYSNHLLNLVAKRIEELTGVKYEDIMYMTPDEAMNLFKGKDHSEILSKVNDRKISLFLSFENGVFKECDGEEAKDTYQKLLSQFRSQFSEIKGQIGNKGSTTGYVKIIRGKGDFHKFNSGDILVAPMTRPEYTHLIEKASAIVTDEGGITCHAAIVSREMNKPCIIGTQVATELLRDGDNIEVDANKGIVRKI
jgi:phosphohistidine swiveling domain-containing protein